MGTELDTQEIPRITAAPLAADGELPHERLFATAMARIQALSSDWQQVLAGSAPDRATGPDRATEPDRATDPHPTVVADHAGDTPVAFPEDGPDDAVAARAAAPRWRRELAA